MLNSIPHRVLTRTNAEATNADNVYYNANARMIYDKNSALWTMMKLN